MSIHTPVLIFGRDLARLNPNIIKQPLYYYHWWLVTWPDNVIDADYDNWAEYKMLELSVDGYKTPLQSAIAQCPPHTTISAHVTTKVSNITDEFVLNMFARDDSPWD